MTPYYERNGITIYNGDCLEVMPGLEPGSVDSVITDPPYGIKFMSRNWDHGVPGIPFWQAVMRVAKPGAFMLAFGGTRTFHRLVCAIEDAGWEIRDSIRYFHDGDEQAAAFMNSLTPEQLEAYLELHYPNGEMAWVYGSGFPKSVNISKMLDKQEYKNREEKVKKALAEKGFTDVVWSNDRE